MLQSIDEEGQWRGLIDVKRGDGGRASVDASLTELTDDKGKRIAIVGVGRDVTDLLRAEKSILEKNEALERMQIELEKALIEGEAARRANRAKDAFLANTSHELRTPLAGVSGMIGLMEETGLTDRQRELVETANVSAHALLTVIDDILDLAKMEAGTLSLRESVFDPIELVSKAAETMRPAAQAKGLKLLVSVPEKSSWFVRGDAGRIRQILFNLVGNAVKFTDDGEISIRLDLVQDAEKSHVTLSVTDTGIGFSASDHDKIFGRFEQLDVSASKSVGGTGLGLAISRELAQLMAGTLDATAVPGEGACFCLDVMLDSAPALNFAAANRVVDADADGIPKDLKVLIAEDNAINQLLVVKLLEKYGWTLKLAANGKQALDLLEANTGFDIILMDIRMPEMDGIEATRRIRRRADSLSRIPIVALTANTMENDKQAYLDAGMNGIVGKPINRAVLLDAINVALGRPV